MGVEREKRDEKLAHILRTAAKVFAEKGYHQASMRDISRATGLSLAGLYHYVKGKEELLYAIQDHCFGTVLEELERGLEGEAEAEGRLRVLVENHLRFFVNNMDEMKVLSHEAGSLTGAYREAVNEKKRRYTQVCMEILKELGPAEGGVDLRVATFSLFGMLNWIYNWYRPGGDVGVSELAEGMSRLFLQGYQSGEAAGAVASGRSGLRGDGEMSIWRT